MDPSKLIGMRVSNRNTLAIGIVVSIIGSKVTIDYHGRIVQYAFPDSFSNILELEDEDLQRQLQVEGLRSSFDDFKRIFGAAINTEINYLQTEGVKKYPLTDGEKISHQPSEYLYAFDTDTDFHFPEGTLIKLWLPDNVVSGYVVSCENFTLIVRTVEYIGETIDNVEFTSEQWQLLEILKDRLIGLEIDAESLAYQVACCGKLQKTEWSYIECGQNAAFRHATTEKITFIWGPPGTGKTEILAKIALEHIHNGNRVLMLSYSNVSVDGALLRVAKMSDLEAGMVIRYGFPRMEELLESKTLTSYQYVLSKNPLCEAQYIELTEKKKKLNRKSPERVSIDKQLNQIRAFFSEQEKALIQKSAFVATTVAKAAVDKAVYNQKFDVVIFDEASMAYIPQVIFAAGMAKKHFVCMGDFSQLPPIVQSKSNDMLSEDIFDYVGITSSVYGNSGHNWLVMLDKQYRMHNDIASFVSQNMYQGKLTTAEAIKASRDAIAMCQPCTGHAMTLVDLSGMYSACAQTTDKSRINIFSALVSLRLAEMNIGKYEVGIITPYNAQSRLLLAMIRDIRERDNEWDKVTCATVHQFQGAEKPIIIYDAVDCFRMPYPGMLLTSMKNDTANRLFNVAVTRAQGKFTMVANTDYLFRKNISKNLLFTKAIHDISRKGFSTSGDMLIEEIESDENALVFVSEKNKSWQHYINDVKNAEIEIRIDIPGAIDNDATVLEELSKILQYKKNNGVRVIIRRPLNVEVPDLLLEYSKNVSYICNPITIIDKEIIWYGQPLCSANFFSEGVTICTLFFPCLRFSGKYTVRIIQALLGG